MICFITAYLYEKWEQFIKMFFYFAADKRNALVLATNVQRHANRTF